MDLLLTLLGLLLLFICFFGLPALVRNSEGNREGGGTGAYGDGNGG